MKAKELNEHIDDEFDEDEPIEEVIGIGKREHPARIQKLKNEFEHKLTLKDRLVSRRRRAVRTMNDDLVEITNEKIQIVIHEIEELRRKLNGSTEQRQDEEDTRDEFEEYVELQTSRHEEHEEPIGRLTEEEEEDEDSIRELAEFFGIEEE